MKWVDRYISEVGDRLPAKQRTDIETELRSLILDALEGRTGKTVDFSEEDELAVLQEFGRPEEVAQRYAGTPRYLIGPRLYPTYLVVLRILFIVGLIGTTFGYLGESLVSNSTGDEIFRNLTTSFFSVLINAIGMATLVFAIIERFSASSLEKGAGKEKAWDPSRLPPIPKGSRVRFGDSVLSVFFSLLALVAVNLMAFRIYALPDFSAHYPVLDRDIFLRFLPWWNLIWGMSLVHAILLWIKGRWSASARVRAIVIDIGSVVLLSFLVSAPLLIADNFLLCGGPEMAAELRQAGEIVPKLLRAGFIGASVFTIWDLVVQVVAMIKSRLN